MTWPWLLRMRWDDICFAHWAVDPRVVARGLPAGCEPDLFEGKAWLSIVPFAMHDIHVRGLPVLPGFRLMPELNLRTYLRFRGRPAVWFFSLDAGSPPAVAAARLTTGLPYYRARLSMRREDGGIRYTSRRTHAGVTPGEFDANYAATGETMLAAPGSLEWFLHERYHFASRLAGRYVTGEVRHQPYRLRPARIQITSNTLGDLIGHSLATAPDHCFYATAVEVKATAA